MSWTTTTKERSSAPRATTVASKENGSALIAAPGHNAFDTVAGIAADLKFSIEAHDGELLPALSPTLVDMVLTGESEPAFYFPDFDLDFDDSAAEPDLFGFEYAGVLESVGASDSVSMEGLDFDFFSAAAPPPPPPVEALVEVASAAVASAKASIPKPSKMKGPSSRATKKKVPDSEKGEVYWKKRLSNTVNAKTSRDRKLAADRAKTEYVAALGVENTALTLQLSKLLTELARLREPGTVQ